MPYVVQTATSGATAPSPLPSFSTVQRCPKGDDDDVVVCGRIDPGRYRLKPLPPRYERDEQHMPEASIPLGGGTLGATAQQGSVGGVSAPRAVLTWKLKF